MTPDLLFQRGGAHLTKRKAPYWPNMAPYRFRKGSLMIDMAPHFQYGSLFVNMAPYSVQLAPYWANMAPYPRALFANMGPYWNNVAPY